MRTATLTAAGAALLAAGLITGCSGSSGSTGAGGANGSNAGAKAQASAISKAVGAGSSIADTSKKACDGITAADAQALLKATTTMTINPFECNWGGKLTVTIYPGDTDKYYDDQTSALGSDGNGKLSIGDKAVWFEPVPGRTVPVVVTRKGADTCEVQLSADPPETTLTYTGSDPFFTIKPADAAAYAAKEGQLCTEVFSALG